MIFSTSNGLDNVRQITKSSFTDLNIWERQHIEEWIRTNPEMLGEELLVVSIEFDRFTNSNDRLDVLALDRAGNLVVIELKRGSTADYADLQAIRYAAMVSLMTIDVLAPYYRSYREKYDKEVLSEAEAKKQLVEFVKSESFSELSNKPRIILCSEGFSQEMTTTVLWLRDSEIDIRCVEITPYQVDEQVIIVPKVVIPLEEAGQYLTAIKRKEEEREQSGRKNRPPTITILLDNHLVQKGEAIFFLKSALPDSIKYDKEDPTFKATITGKRGQSDAVKWERDGEEYSITGVTRKILKDLHPEKDPHFNGSWYWGNADGKPLAAIAEEQWAKGS